MLLPHAQKMREIMRLCLFRAAALCHRGEYERATDSLIATIKAAETLQAEPLLVAQLVRIAIHGVTENAIAFALSDEDFPAEQIERLRNELLQIDRDSACRTAMIGERVQAYQAMLGTFDEINEMTDSDQPSIAGFTDRPLRELRPGDCAMLLELSTDAVEVCTGEYAAQWDEQVAFGEREEAMLKNEMDKAPWNMSVLTTLILPAHDAAFTGFIRGAGRHRCTIALLAAEQFRRERGDYPQQLEDLVPVYLPTLPDDPYTGGPLRMRHVPGQRFVIYAVGKNGVDDGGEIDQNANGQPLDTGVGVPPFRAPPE